MTHSALCHCHFVLEKYVEEPVARRQQELVTLADGRRLYLRLRDDERLVPVLLFAGLAAHTACSGKEKEKGRTGTQGGKGNVFVLECISDHNQ